MGDSLQGEQTWPSETEMASAMDPDTDIPNRRPVPRSVRISIILLITTTLSKNEKKRHNYYDIIKLVLLLLIVLFLTVYLRLIM